MASSNTHGLAVLVGSDVVATTDEVPIWDDSAATTKRITVAQFAAGLGASTVPIAALVTDPTARSNHTGTQLSTTISDFTEAAQDAVGAAATSSARVTLTYNDGANTITPDLVANTVTATYLTTSVAGSGLSGGNGTALAVQVDGSTVEISSNAIRAKDGGITRAKLITAMQPEVVQIYVSDPNGSALTTGEGKAFFRVPSTLTGLHLRTVAAHVTTVSSSGLPSIGVRSVTGGYEMLTTNITIDANEKDTSTAATPAVIDTSSSHDVVTTADEIAIDVDTAGTGTKGLIVELQFSV